MDSMTAGNSKDEILDIKVDNPKKCRRKLTIKLKLEIIDRIGKGDSLTQIARSLGLHYNTVRNIKNEKLKLMEYASCISNDVAVKSARFRNSVIATTETLLYNWINDSRSKGENLTTEMVTRKALSLFSYVKTKIPEDDGKNKNFRASPGWFQRFKNRFNLHNINFGGEYPNPKEKAAFDFENEFKNIVRAEDYTSKQVFVIDETVMYCKILPKNYVKDGDCKSSDEAKNEDERLTLILGGNANGDSKLTPLVLFHSETPVIEDLKKSKLPVIWYSSKKARVTRSVFTEWFTNHFVPFITQYNAEQNLDNKTLLIVSNATNYPTELNTMYDNIRIIFLPPSASNILRPKDIGIISIFKTHYLQETGKQMTHATSGVQEKSKLYWQSYNIKSALDSIDRAWSAVSSKSMNGIWRQLWPECITKTPQERLSTSNTNSLDLAKKSEGNDCEMFEKYDDPIPDDLLQLEYGSDSDYLENEMDIKMEELHDSNQKDPWKEFFSAANHLKDLAEKLELNKSRLKSFNMVVDGLMVPYKSMAEQASTSTSYCRY